MVGYFTIRVRLHDQWGPRSKTSIRRCWTWLLGRSSWLSGTEVAGARDGSWSRRCFTWLYLIAKLSHSGLMWMGVACFLHRPMFCYCQTGIELPDRHCPIPSCCSGRWRLLGGGGCKAPRSGYLTGGEILSTHNYRNEEKRWCGLLMCLVLF
jgi:hypothetical protein